MEQHQIEAINNAIRITAVITYHLGSTGSMGGFANEEIENCIQKMKDVELPQSIIDNFTSTIWTFNHFKL